MSHRVDRHLTRPDVDGGDTHTAAVFLLSFLLMGVVSAIMLAGLGIEMPDLYQNRLIANYLGGSRNLPKLSEAAAEGQGSAAVVSVPKNQIAEPVKAEPTIAPVATRVVRVANTEGAGVYVRRTTNLADRLVAWPDNTRMEIVGEDKRVAGVTWRNIKDPAGNVGWIPAEYLSE